MLLCGAAVAQRAPTYQSVAETRDALQRALGQQQQAEQRGARLEAKAARATEAADRTANRTAALAARIQQSEAAIAAAEARIVLIGDQRRVLSARLAQRQKPLVRLTAALQNLSRRPLALSVLRPGSVRDIVYLRAMLATTIPRVAAQTAGLQTEMVEGQRLQSAAHQQALALRAGERGLAERRARLATIESRQRFVSRQASGVADREAERALALAEEARDLDSLVDRLGEAHALRDRLAGLPGPIMRPPRPQDSEVMTPAMIPSPRQVAAPADYQLPVTGRTIAGFGDRSGGGAPVDGLSLAPVPRAQVVAPGAGRIAFAGPYRGYDRIVIVEHSGGWTSLITGLARVDTRVGTKVIAGTPIGIAGADRPVVTLELRRDGQPVNPVGAL